MVFVSDGLLARLIGLTFMVLFPGDRPAGVAGLVCPISVTSLGLATLVFNLLINCFTFPFVLTLGFVWASVTMSSTKVAKSLEDRNSPIVPIFSLHSVNGVWVSALTMTGRVPIAGHVSAAVSRLLLSVCIVRDFCCCDRGLVLALGATGASVSEVAVSEEAAFILLVAAAYDNFSVLASTSTCLASL